VIGPGLKGTVKNAVEALSAAAGVAAWRRSRRATRGGPVILAYHQVTDEILHPGHAAELSVGVAEFESHADYLAAQGRVVALREAVAAAVSPRPGEPGVAITFDDGYAGVHDAAFPILRERRLPFAVFITTGIIGTRKILPGEDRFPGVLYPKLDWDHVARMAEQGATIGAHGVTHRRLTLLTPQEALEEITRSKEEIERRLGQPVVYFAYPFGGPGDFDEASEEIIVRAGYEACFLCASSHRLPESPYRIDRMPIWRGISSTAFANICQGAAVSGMVTALSRRLRSMASLPGRREREA